VGGAEIVKRTLEAFNRRDAEAMIALQHAEVEFVPITAAMEGRIYRGPDETREFLRSLQLDWEVFEARPEEYYETSDRGLALGTWYARGRGSQVELLAERGGWFASIRDGLVYRWRTCTDTADALAAFGVGEEELPRYRAHPP
jgi:ketosteroid isomerase-like protein